MINTLEKSVNKTNFANGIMPKASAERFIQMIFDSSPLLKGCRTITMKGETQTLAGILESKRQTRIVDTENQDQSAFRRGMSAYSFDILTKEFSLSRTVSNKVLKDNIEGGNLGLTVAKNLASMFREDLEDSAINSVSPTGTLAGTISGAHSAVVTTIDIGADPVALGFPALSGDIGYLAVNDGAGNIELISYTGITGNTFTGCVRGLADPDLAITTPASAYVGGETLTWQAHHLLGKMNGWVELIKNPLALSSVSIDGSVINAGAVSYDHFSTMRKNLPKKYRSSENVFLMGSDQLENYRNWLVANHSQTFAGNVITDENFAPIKAITPEQWPEDLIILTNPKNLVLGVWDQVKMRKITADTDSKLADTDETYWNLRLRAGYGIERADACVILDGLTV